MSENINPPEDLQPKKNNAQMKIVGYNLLAFLIYTLIGLASLNGEGFILFTFLFVAHAIGCTITAIAKRQWVWFLSGVLIFIIGFSTCVGVISR